MGELLRFISALESGFNRRFGWFFTNGNKIQRMQNDPQD